MRQTRRSMTTMSTNPTTPDKKAEAELSMPKPNSKRASPPKPNTLSNSKPGSYRIAVPKVDFLHNMSIAELSMIHRLAGNDPDVRKATIRKLRKWLKAISRKIPDSPESKALVHANFGRVWKALFYCMWMADKPIPQETLAEQISNFVSIFSEKPNVMILFVEWFFITFVREWPWIDRLRMDKYMMLIRRFLRKMLQEFCERNWEGEILNSFLDILSVHLFNHQPQSLMSKKEKKKVPDPPKAPLGFQIHIVDIFLEELAKVGGETLESTQILKILTVFVEEMRKNDDIRLLDEIKQRVFHHLMKQSDVGIDYIESRGGALELLQADAVDDDECEGEMVEEVKKPGNIPLDPRAGAVDVTLPQLKLDYDALIETLNTAAIQDDTRAKNRKMLLGLARQFQTLQNGEYPLGSKRVGSRIPAIKRSEIEAAANRLIEMEDNLKEPKLKKRKNKKSEKDQFQQFSMLSESIGSEDDSNFLNDSNIMDHVTENYDGYLKQMQNGDNRGATPKKEKMTEGAESASVKATPKSPRNVKLAKRRAKSLGLNSVPAAASLTSPTSRLKPASPTPTKPAAPAQKPASPTQPKPSAPGQNSYSAGKENSESSQIGIKKIPEGDTYITISRNRKRRMSEPVGLESSSKVARKSLTSDEVANVYSSLLSTMKVAPEALQPTPKLKRKSESVLLLRKRKSPVKSPTRASTPSSMKKKVNFVLTKNLEHPHADYAASIQRSPAIPYDGAKRPSFGLLKTQSPASTPVSLSPRKRLLSSFSVTAASGSSSPFRKSTPIPRRRASDFFGTATDFL